MAQLPDPKQPYPDPVGDAQKAQQEALVQLRRATRALLHGREEEAPAPEPVEEPEPPVNYQGITIDWNQLVYDGWVGGFSELV